ncbi:MAG: large-conductance mechanosensitive channel protein MscL [Bacteroidia bacterium]|nr:large-conductance mechanosensitive channel protein MscL [Bacteroidia bacterium]
MIKEFKAFLMRGNVVDLAVALVIGAAFGKIIASLVSDVIMPPIGIMLGGVDFSDLMMIIKEADPAVEGSEAVAIKYGAFIMTIIEFVIIGAAIFMVVKAIASSKKKEEAGPPPAPPKEEVLLTEIRDLLKK